MEKIIKYALLLTIPFIFTNSILVTNSIGVILLGIVIYSLFDFRYPLFFLPMSFLTSNLLDTSFIIITIGLSIILNSCYKKKKIYILFYFVLLFSSISLIYIIFGYMDTLVYIINFIMLTTLTSSILYTLNIYHLPEEDIIKINNTPLFYTFICVVLSISLRHHLLAFSLTLLLLSFLALLEYKKIHLLFAIYLFFLLYDYPNNYLILIFSVILLIPKYYPFLISASLTMFDYFITKELNKEEFLAIFIISLAFWLMKYTKFSFITKKTSILNMYDNIINNFNDQVLKFASFLDEFERKFITNREDKVHFAESYNYLINTFCVKCPRSNICLIEKKNETYIYLKNILLHGKNIRIKRESSLPVSFIDECINFDGIVMKGNFFKNKFNFSRDKRFREQSLERQLIGVSNTLRQYVIDLSSKREMCLDMFLSLKNKIIETGFQIILFDVKRIFKDDFWIEAGIVDITKDELEIINSLAQKCLGIPVSIKIKKCTERIIYINIIPYIKYNILYGSGAISKDNLDFGGDNYMIKDSQHGIFIAAISDGMGAGYKAYTESRETLELIDKITEFEINPNTSINMLNTFYSLKENMEQYATLDFLEINKSSGEATLFKMGSSNTYLIRNQVINTIHNENMPFGMNDLIKKEEFKINDKDTIILASDGIVDHIDEQNLFEKFRLSLHKSPSEIAYDILNFIINTNKTALDDMSIIVLKIEKNTII